jgi:mucin-19
MANTTSASLKLTVQATGENSGTWGQITNTNLLILEQAIGGYAGVALNATTGATLTFSNGALSDGKNQVLKLTGTITTNVDVIVPDSVEKTYVVENATSGAFTVTVKTTSGSGVTWAATDKGKKMVYSDGTNVVDTAFTEVVSDVSPQLGGMLDVNGQAIGDGTLELIKFAETASAVNEITITNAATGTNPIISATGNDTNVGITLTPKGTGKVVLSGLSYPTADGTAGQFLRTNGSGVLSFAGIGLYTVDFLAIAGGGSGGLGRGGGGGAGGYRNSFSTESSGGGGSSEASLTFNVGTTYTITVGAGGAAIGTSGKGNNGVDSSIAGTGLSTITSTGGGGGGAVSGTSGAGQSGGSGGGGGGSSSPVTGGAGTGTANQGRNGGAGVNYGAAGGGGADTAGSNGGATAGGAGGNGLASSITGSSITRAGGGGGGGYGVGPNGAGGSGGGGAGTGIGGTINTGSGGGGRTPSPSVGSGGSGVVILRMPTANYSGITTGSPTVSTDGSDTILVYNGTGSYIA